MCLIKHTLYKIKWEDPKMRARGIIYLWASNIDQVPIDLRKALSLIANRANITQIKAIQTENDDD
jgi:hypothetical protein